MPERHHERWSTEEDGRLLKMVRSHCAWSAIGATLGRSPLACSTRLVNLRSVLGQRAPEEIRELQDLLAGREEPTMRRWS